MVRARGARGSRNRVRPCLILRRELVRSVEDWRTRLVSVIVFFIFHFLSMTSVTTNDDKVEPGTGQANVLANATTTSTSAAGAAVSHDPASSTLDLHASLDAADEDKTPSIITEGPLGAWFTLFDAIGTLNDYLFDFRGVYFNDFYQLVQEENHAVFVEVLPWYVLSLQSLHATGYMFVRVERPARSRNFVLAYMKCARVFSLKPRYEVLQSRLDRVPGMLLASAELPWDKAGRVASIGTTIFERTVSKYFRFRWNQQEQYQVMLLEAALSGDEDSVLTLIDGGVDPNVETGRNETVMHIAASNGCSYSYFHKLLSKMTNLNAQDRAGRTALHYAASHNYYGIVESLVQRGVDLNTEDLYGFTPLGLAMLELYDNSESVALLVTAGAIENRREDSHVPNEELSREDINDGTDTEKGEKLSNMAPNDDAEEVGPGSSATSTTTADAAVSHDPASSTLDLHASLDAADEDKTPSIITEGPLGAWFTLFDAIGTLNDYLFDFRGVYFNDFYQLVQEENHAVFVEVLPWYVLSLQSLHATGYMFVRVERPARSRNFVLAYMKCARVFSLKPRYEVLQSRLDRVPGMLLASAELPWDKAGRLSLFNETEFEHFAAKYGDVHGPMYGDVHGPMFATRGEQPLLLLEKAIRDLNDKATMVFLAGGVNPNEVDGNGCNGLHHAAMAGCSLRVLHMLLKQVDVNARDKYGYTALMYAAMYNRADMVDVLLQVKGISLNESNKIRNTALEFAVSQNNHRVIDSLTQAGAAVSAQTHRILTCRRKDSFQFTLNMIEEMGEIRLYGSQEILDPLAAAIYGGQEDAAHVLLDGGLNPFGLALTVAADRGCSQHLWEALLSKLNDARALNEWPGNTALLLAARANRIDRVDSLLLAGADPNVVDADADDRAAFFIIEGDYRIDLDHYHSPLHFAVLANNLDMVHSLIQANGIFLENCVRRMNIVSNTALFLAAELNHHEILEALIKAGARVNVCTSSRHDHQIGTPLSIAVRRGFVESIALLEAAGAVLPGDGEDEYQFEKRVNNQKPRFDR